MNILFESMKFFDLNILLDSKKKINLSKINKNKIGAPIYKKSKTKSIVYPEDEATWTKFLDKTVELINKL